MFPRILIAVCLLFGSVGVYAAAQSGNQSIWTGVYSEPQAVRGQTSYRKHCSYCHREDLLGGEDLRVIPPALVGFEFESRFFGKSVGHLLKRITSTMPWGKGKLPPEEYSDILAYILKENGFPAGDRELPTDPAAVDAVMLTAK